MTTKRLNVETSDEAPLDKRGCSDVTSMGDLGTELDDEVEKELQEFERLQSGLLGVTSQKKNVRSGATKESTIAENENLEKNNGSGSDMEVDEDLEREIAEAEKKSPRTPLQKTESVSDKPFLDETVCSNIRVLPDTFAEENLRGDDLLEKSGIPADGEEACLEMETARLHKEPPTTDPLNPECTDPHSTKPWNQASRSKLEQSEADPSVPKVWSNGSEQLKSQPRKRKPKEEEEDFPSPGKRKPLSCGSTTLSKSSQSGTAHDGVQDPNFQNYDETSQRPMPPLTRVQKLPSKALHLKNTLPRMVQSPVTKMSFQEPATQRHPKTTPPSESDISTSLPGTSQKGDETFHAEPLKPKGSLVDPVLKIPIHPTSIAFVTKETFVNPVFKIPVQPKSSSNKNPSFRDPIFDNPKPSCSKDYQVETDSTQTMGPSEYQMRKMVIQSEQAEEKIAEKIPQLGQHHVRAINFDQPTLFNQNMQQTKTISAAYSTSERLDLPLALPLSRPNNPKPPKHPAYMNFLRNSDNLVNPATCLQKPEVKEPSPQNQPVNAQPTKFIKDVTTDPPVEYCVIEQVIRKRFEHSFQLDDDKFELMEAGRPRKLCPELHPHMKVYYRQTWLTACNELKKFYCWPCLFFASKVIWSCDEETEVIVGKEINKHKQSAAHQESLKQRDVWSLKKKSSIIKTLLKNNFVDGTWSDENQEAIIMKGRPRPILNKRAERKSKADKQTAFEEFYRRVNWICGCTSSEKFYCWPCVLFCRMGDSAEGYAYAGTIESAEPDVLLHEMSPKHMEACLKLGKLEFSLKKKSEAKREEIEKMRNFLGCLVEVLCAEKKSINNSEFSAVDCVDTLEIMSEYNRNLKTFMDEKSKNSYITMAQTAARYIPAILDSVEYFIKSGILDELRNSNSISLIFDHSSGLSHKAILSVIARYVDRNGHVHERFVKLLNVGYNTPSNTLSDEFFQTIVELQCRSTLVGFTYDGYLVKPEKIPEFNAKVQKLCPDAKFFHYNEHSFNRVLNQTLSHMPVCRSVLQVITELTTFFECIPGTRKGLLDIIKSTKKSERDDFWRSPDFIRTVFIYHAVIVQIMETIIKNARNWKVKIVVQASNFLNFFKDAKNRFFITVIARIYHAVQDLNKALDEDDGDANLITIANHTVEKIQKFDRNFDNVLDSACSHLEGSVRANTRMEMSHFSDLFTSALRLVVELIKNRIIELESGYFKISKDPPTSSSALSIKSKSQNLFLHNVALPSKFNSAKLLREIQFIHDASIFSGLDLSEIISQMRNYNMIEVLPEFFKFLQMVLTAPKKLYGDSTIPAVHRISAYLEGKKDLNSTDALLWMEKEFLTNLQKGANFYGKVTDRVLSITKYDGFVKSNSKM